MTIILQWTSIIPFRYKSRCITLWLWYKLRYYIHVLNVMLQHVFDKLIFTETQSDHMDAIEILQKYHHFSPIAWTVWPTEGGRFMTCCVPLSVLQAGVRWRKTMQCRRKSVIGECVCCDCYQASGNCRQHRCGYSWSQGSTPDSTVSNIYTKCQVGVYRPSIGYNCENNAVRV